MYAKRRTARGSAHRIRSADTGGDATIPARLQLLTEQRESLLEQRAKIDTTLKRLAYKIHRYEVAVETGVLTWPSDCQEDSAKGSEES